MMSKRGGGFQGRRRWGSCSPVEVEVAGLGWRVEGRAGEERGWRGMCGGQQGWGGKGCVFVCVGGGSQE